MSFTVDSTRAWGRYEHADDRPGPTAPDGPALVVARGHRRADGRRVGDDQRRVGARGAGRAGRHRARSSPTARPSRPASSGTSGTTACETRSGHTIVRRHGWWVYAAKRPDGSLRATDLRVGEDRPVARKHLRDATKAEQADRARAPAGPGHRAHAIARMAGARRVATGSDPVLVILVQFQNQANLGTTQSQWASRYFGHGQVRRRLLQEELLQPVHLRPGGRFPRHRQQRRRRLADAAGEPPRRATDRSSARSSGTRSRRPTRTSTTRRSTRTGTAPSRTASCTSTW